MITKENMQAVGASGGGESSFFQLGDGRAKEGPHLNVVLKNHLKHFEIYKNDF